MGWLRWQRKTSPAKRPSPRFWWICWFTAWNIPKQMRKVSWTPNKMRISSRMQKNTIAHCTTVAQFPGISAMSTCLKHSHVSSPSTENPQTQLYGLTTLMSATHDSLEWGWKGNNSTSGNYAGKTMDTTSLSLDSVLTREQLLRQKIGSNQWK